MHSRAIQPVTMAACQVPEDIGGGKHVTTCALTRLRRVRHAREKHVNGSVSSVRSVRLGSSYLQHSDFVILYLLPPPQFKAGGFTSHSFTEFVRDPTVLNPCPLRKMSTTKARAPPKA